jgi:hypothetical protein
MPIHDWTRVTAGTWHAFHLSWIAETQLALNEGRLPPSYYVQAEQIAGPLGPDVLTLQTPEFPPELGIEEPSTGGLAVATVPGTGDLHQCAARRNLRGGLPRRAPALEARARRHTAAVEMRYDGSNPTVRCHCLRLTSAGSPRTRITPPRHNLTMSCREPMHRPDVENNHLRTVGFLIGLIR